MENMGLKKKILITGGLGNLGSWLTHHYASVGYKVFVFTKRYRKLEFDLPFDIIEGDVTCIEDCKKINKYSFDIIIHAASMNDYSVDNYANDALITNALGTRNILETIKNKPPKHFIYLSTFHVYGKYTGNISEDTDPIPTDDYGITHLFAEYYIKQFYKNHKVPYTIIRLSNSYGCPKDYNSSKWYLLLNNLSKSAFEKGYIKLNTNGLATRDFIWMGDVCSIIHKLTEKPSTNETYNLSGEKAYSLLDLAKAVKEAYQEYFKKDIQIQTNENDRSSSQAAIFISSSKLKKHINYSAKSHFKDEATKIFNFLNKNK
jgi:nucleoside-diphosphate-sugar epimerase